MADKNTLREMSKDVLVIPFSEEVAEKLDEFCRTQTNNINRDRVQELTLCFLMRENDETLEKAFADFASNDDVLKTMVSAAIIPVLEEYIVILAIEECQDDEEQVLRSLLLKNALVLAVKGDGFVTGPKAVADTFSLYRDFIDDEKTFEENDEGNETLKGLLDAGEDELTNKMTEADGDVMKGIVYDAARFRYEKFIKGLTVERENLASSLYEVTKQLAEESPWLYIDATPAVTLKNLVGEAGDTALTLKEVKDQLSETFEPNEDGFLMTSILLRFLDDDEDGLMLSGDTTFRADELAVYLYYELLAEKMYDEIEETEE